MLSIQSRAKEWSHSSFVAILNLHSFEKGLVLKLYIKIELEDFVLYEPIRAIESNLKLNLMGPSLERSLRRIGVGFVEPL